MSTQTKFYKLLVGLMLLSSVTFAQAPRLLEFTWNNANGGPPVTGQGYGPRITDHVVTFARDSFDNNFFENQTLPTPLTASFKLQNQQYTGFTYGAGSLYPVSTGLVFGASPSTAFGVPPQQVIPLDSYGLLGTFGGGGGPKNGMFKSNCTNPPVANYPGGSGTGVDAQGTYPTGGNDNTGGIEIFTVAQRMKDLNNPAGAGDRYYYGDLTIQFNQFVDSAVIHVAGLGGSYRYFVAGGSQFDPADWRSTFFSTELELVWPNYAAVQVTKMAGNEFLSVSGKNINNTAFAPNGESVDVGAIPLPNWNNYGAASGSVRITGARTNYVKFKIYLRGSAANALPNNFNWSAPAVASGGARDPLTGDIWYISASVKSPLLTPSCVPGDPGCTSLPATGVQLAAALNGNDVALSWKTESEINSDHFEIERSTDNINYSRIGNKQAAGNSTATINYSAVDPSMAAAVYYYRLKIVDINGNFTYSNVAFVRKPNGVKNISVFPNPVTDQVNIQFVNAKGKYDITFFNQSGQKVMNRNATIESTVQTVNMAKGSLPAGSYIISARNTETNEKYVQNVIFQ